MRARSVSLVSAALMLAALAPASAPALSTSSYQLRVLRTAYCLRGSMRNGRYVHWGAVATDRRVIPEGTRMFIPGYGYGVSEDTGSAVNGNHVDVWMPSCSAALRFTSYVTITVFR